MKSCRQSWSLAARMFALLWAALIALPASSRAAEAALPADLLRLLTTSIDEDWREIFGVEDKEMKKPGETWAEKLVAFQKVVARSTEGKNFPLFISPELAATKLPAPPPEPPRIYLELRRVPLIEALKHITQHTNTRSTLTKHGVLLDVIKPPKAK